METSCGAPAIFHAQHTQGHVLCCLCGTSILSNPSNMCVNCIRSQVDITEGMQKQVTILWCKECGRYLQPPKHWVRADPESKELLTFCIKRIKGLAKVKLVDAGFIWTEPHSKRLKIKLTIQAEVFNGAILQQTFVVEYVVENHMCLDCTRHNANPNTWTACVQVRQHVAHKRTFLFLEQLILKHAAADSATNIRDIHEGIDFFFSHRAHGSKFIDFLQGVVPVRFRNDKQLVSHDTHTSTYNYKYTFSVELVPICKDDLCILPHKISASLGSLGPLVLVSRVTNTLTLMDPTNLRSAQMDAPGYWRSPFTALCSAKQLVEYMVLDIELLGDGAGSNFRNTQGQGGGQGKWAMAEAQVARMSDFGRNDTTFFTRTHLGNILHPGDTVLGYDLANANLVGLDFDAHVARGGALPDVVLVRKSYEERRRKVRRKGDNRAWKLRRLPMEVEEADRKRNNDGEEADRERFMQELEEDADLRSRINIYKDGNAAAAAGAAGAKASLPRGMEEETEEGSDEEGDMPQIPLEELLDDLEALGIDEGPSEDEEGDEDGSDMMEG